MDLDTLINFYMKNLPPKKKFLVRWSLNLSAADPNLKSKRNFNFYNKQIDAERAKKAHKNQIDENEKVEKYEENQKANQVKEVLRKENGKLEKEIATEDKKIDENSKTESDSKNDQNSRKSRREENSTTSKKEEKCLKISKVFSLNEEILEDLPQFTLLDNENNEEKEESSEVIKEQVDPVKEQVEENTKSTENLKSIEQPIKPLENPTQSAKKITQEPQKVSTPYKLQKTGPNSFKISIPGSFCEEANNLIVSKNLQEIHQKLPEKVSKKSTKIWRPFEDSKSSGENSEIKKSSNHENLNLNQNSVKNNSKLAQESEEISDEVKIIENPEEIIDLTDLEDHPELNSSSSSESDKLIIEVQDEVPRYFIKTEIINKEIKQEKIDKNSQEFIQNYPDIQSRKRRLESEDDRESKRRRMPDSYQKFNEKFLKLILQRAQAQNQEKVICRFYQCLRCGVKIYLKKVFDYHVSCHRWFSDKEIKVGYGVIRMKNKNLEN